MPEPTRPLRKYFLFAFLAGLVQVAGFAPVAWFFLPWLALAALLVWLRGLGSARQAFALGFSFGLGAFLGGVSWVYVSLSVFGGMPAALAALSSFLFCALLALFPPVRY